MASVLSLLERNIHYADPPLPSADYPSLDPLGRFDAEIRTNHAADLLQRAYALEPRRRNGGARIPSYTYTSLLDRALGSLRRTIRDHGLSGGLPIAPPFTVPAAIKEACDLCKLIMVSSLTCVMCLFMAEG